MEKVDRELLLRIAPTNPELQQLYEEHLELEARLQEMENYAGYSVSASLEEKRLKKQKLRGMDTIQSILATYRSSETDAVQA